MEKIIPEKLKKGDEIRIIAPSRNINILNEETINIAKNTLEDMGFKVTLAKNIYNTEYEEYGCSSIEDRIEDLHDAFKDKNVKAILTVIGGFNVNQILDYIDYDLIKNNPKIICGYSDITALLEAITTKTGLVTYYGPHFSTFGIKLGNEYTIDYFKKVLLENNEVEVNASDKWSNDLWFLDQNKREFENNNGLEVINYGSGTGTIIGGNLCTLNLLQGTSYMPKANDIILFIEDDGENHETFTKTFDRDIESLLQCLGKENIKGIVVGRAEKNCQMNYDKWKMIFATKKELKDIPIVINVDFGHTNPMMTIPLGGTANVNVTKERISITMKS